MSASVDQPSAGSAGGDAIRAEALTKTYGTHRSVDGLSFRVPRGAVTGFVGPNGAGKSTTIRMLLGLIAPSSGQATVLGGPVSAPQSYLSKVGALVEAPTAYTGLSGRRNLRILAALRGVPHSRIDEVLQTVQLSGRADDRVKAYSLGMKQRLGIAAALLGSPELLVLDEPVNGLDPAGINEIRGLLRGFGDGGMTVFVSSHLLSEVEQICDWLVVIRQGRLAFNGPTRELVAGAREGLTVAAAQEGGLAAVERICAEAGHSAERRDGKVHITCPTSWGAVLNRAAMDQGVVLSEIVPWQSRLEEVFLEVTGDGAEPGQRSSAEPRSEEAKHA